MVRSIIIANDNSLIVTGYTQITYTNADFFLVKISEKLRSSTSTPTSTPGFILIPIITLLVILSHKKKTIKK